MNRSKTIVTLAAVLAVALALPALAQVKDHRKIKYPKLEDFKIQKPEIYTMDNGMKVFLMEDHELPLVNVVMRIRTGGNWEPADKTGLAGIFGQILREGGTESMTGDEIDEYLAQRAASVETSVGDDVGFASANSLVDRFDDTLAVLADVLRNPVFAEDKIDVAKNQTNSAISRRNDAISGITGREFNRLIYGPDSPIGRLTEYASIATITRSDLIDWHKKFFHPNNIYVGVVGDFDSQAMKRKLEKAFGNWPKGADLDLPEVDYDKKMQAGNFFIEKDDTTQAYVRLGHLGRKMAADPDNYALDVMNEVLGGSFASRLFSNVRSKKGLAYSVFGGVGSGMARQGVFQVGLSTKSETMAESVEALREEVNGIIDKPATAEELARAKESILNSFVFRYDTKSEILGQLMLYDYYGLPADYLDTYQSRIEAVTTDDVARVAKTYIRPDKLKLLVVGKAADFDQPVSTFGIVTTVDIAIAPPPDTAPKLVRSAANVEAGRAVFAKAVDKVASGTKEKLRAIKGQYTLALSMGGQQMTMQLERELLLPDKIRRTMKTPMGEQTIVLNGERGYTAMGGQTQNLPSTVVAESHQELSRELLLLIDRHDDPELETVAAGSGDVDGSPCEFVAVSYRGVESRLCVGSDGAVLSQSYQGKHPMQQTPGRMEIRYSDYGDIDGRNLPRKSVVSFEGEEVFTLTTNSLEFNPDLDESQFEIPN